MEEYLVDLKDKTNVASSLVTVALICYCFRKMNGKKINEFLMYIEILLRT